MTTRAVKLLIALLWLCAPSGADDLLTVGAWEATLGPGGPTLVTYDGQPLFRRGQITGYLPDWKGTRFAMGDAELTRTDTSARWAKSVADDQAAELTLSLTPQGCTLSVDTIVTAAGPSEYSVQIDPAAVRATETGCYMVTDGVAQVLDLATPLRPPSGFKKIRFEQPERSVILSCTSGFQIQNRIGQGSGLFLVKVMNSTGDTPVRYQESISFEIIPADAGQIEARTALYSQAPTISVAVDVPNGDFEAGTLESWSSNPRAALDTEVKRSGTASARISLTDAEADAGNVYMTQNIPVKPGAFYEVEAMIRTADVKPAVLGGRPATGGTIIIEFTDTQKKWLAAGAYADGVYGTSDFRAVRSKPARAPDDAGYATIFLALRGLGTAWFDDVKLTEVQHNVVMEEPAFGQAIADNTPTFRWSLGVTAPSAVELSQDGTFAAGVTTVPADALGCLARTARPIAPGKWYWRVQVPGYQVNSPVWHFEQTAGIDQDCTEPEVDVRHGYLSEPRQPVQIRYRDNVAVTDVRLLVDGHEVTEGVTVRPTRVDYAPKTDWTPGLNRLRVRVTDAAGNSTEAEAFFTHSEPLPKTEWALEGGVQREGGKEFLLGMYGVSIEHMATMADAGFDFVHAYTWDGAGTNETAIEYLDAAQSHGLQAFIGFSRSKLIAGDDAFIAERVGALMRHPGLFAWYLFDEPDLAHQYVAPPLLQHQYELIKALDPYHPVIVTCAGDNAVSQYKDTLDVHWTQVYGTPAHVQQRIERHRGMLNPGTPISAILHCYDRQQTGLLREGDGPEPEKFTPTPRHMRAAAFMAIAHGSSGLEWWWWGHAGKNAYTVAHVPAAWEGLKQVVADIRSLRHVLTADGDVHTWVEEPAEGVRAHIWEKQLPGQTVIIAVNESETQGCELSFRPKTLPPSAPLEVLFEGGIVKLTDGVLQASFEPWGAHVYENRTR